STTGTATRWRGSSRSPDFRRPGRDGPATSCRRAGAGRPNPPLPRAVDVGPGNLRREPGHLAQGQDRLAKKCRDLADGFVVVAAQEVAAGREADESSSRNVVRGVARAVVCPVEVVLNADGERQDGDFLELVPGERGDDRRVVDQPGASLGDRQNLP